MNSNTDSGVMMDTGALSDLGPGNTGKLQVVSPIPVKKYLFVLILILLMTIAFLVALIIRQHRVIAEDTAASQNLQLAEEM